MTTGRNGRNRLLPSLIVPPPLIGPLPPILRGQQTDSTRRESEGRRTIRESIVKLDQDPQASPRESGNLEYEDLCEKAGSQRECQWQLTHSGGTAVKVTATLLARASEPRTAQSGPIQPRNALRLVPTQQKPAGYAGRARAQAAGRRRRHRRRRSHRPARTRRSRDLLHRRNHRCAGGQARGIMLV